MARIDLRKFALRLKVVEMIEIYARRRLLQEAHRYWRRLIQPN